MFCYERSKVELREGWGWREGPAQHVASAVIAGCLADAVTAPLFVVRTRMQTQYLHATANAAPPYTSTVDALRTIARVEGFRALYKGLGTSLLLTSHPAIYFPIYEELRVRLRAAFPHGDGAPPDAPAGGGGGGGAGRPAAASSSSLAGTAQVLAASSLAKLIASTITFPLEVLRSRLQDQRETRGQPPRYRGLLASARRVAAEEGVAALYSGLRINLARVVPATAITFSAYDFLITECRAHGMVP
jgi:solute carrier family 25 folate transporter 32